MANFIAFAVDRDLFDAAGEDELAAFDETRTFAWGGFVGMSRGITLMDENAAKEIAAWIARYGMTRGGAVALVGLCSPAGARGARTGPASVPIGDAGERGR